MDFKAITKAQKFRLQSSRLKTMLITFCDKQGVMHTNIVPDEQTVSSAFTLRLSEDC
jgi:hypothetical protein